MLEVEIGLRWWVLYYCRALVFVSRLTGFEIDYEKFWAKALRHGVYTKRVKRA